MMEPLTDKAVFLQLRYAHEFNGDCRFLAELKPLFVAGRPD